MHSELDVLRRHIAHPLDALKGRKPLGAESVHAIRKELKRARAGLRLLRDAVGEVAYAEENSRLRDAARPLARVRDAEVTIATIDSLIGRKKLHQHRAALIMLRARLRQERSALQRALEGSTVENIHNALTQSGARVSHWRVPHDVWPILRDGLKRIYRRGRKALSGARALGSDRNLHEARKQVKYLGYAMEILGPVEAPRLARLAKRADSIAERLGEDHDLAVLRRRLDRADRELLARIERRRAKLQKKALKKARRLYRLKPKAFIARLESARVLY